MEKQTSDEYSTRLKNYDALVLGDPMVLENTIAGMSDAHLIEFYEYCQEKLEAEVEQSDMYWYASLLLEETPIVRMYRNGQLYVEGILGNIDEPRTVGEELSEEDIAQINATIELLEQRRKEKKNPIKQLLKNIRGK